MAEETGVNIYTITYRFPGDGKVMEAITVAKDEVYAWINVYRRHYLAVELLTWEKL
jgi:hypothetical protein